MLEMPHIHFLVWLRYLGMEWNMPTRSDYYQMQTAAEIRQIRNSFSKGARSATIREMKLRFTTAEQRKAEKEREYTDAELKQMDAVWAMRLGLIGPDSRQPRTKREPGPRPNQANQGIAPKRAPMNSLRPSQLTIKGNRNPKKDPKK